jgi:hypothetical protein
MKFELKNAVSVGDVKSKDANNSLQYLNITVGVVDNPHQKMTETQTVEYVFPNTITIQEAKDGVIPFAQQWVADNFPNI